MKSHYSHSPPYSGQIEGFPFEVVEKMLEYQELQGFTKDISVFERCRDAGDGSAAKGFCWQNTPEQHNFWEQVIRFQRFDLFFEKYPKRKTDQSILTTNKQLTSHENPGDSHPVIHPVPQPICRSSTIRGTTVRARSKKITAAVGPISHKASHG